jgi:hypothetical protein
MSHWTKRPKLTEADYERIGRDLELHPWKSAFWPAAMKGLGEWNSWLADICSPFKMKETENEKA